MLQEDMVSIVRHRTKEHSSPLHRHNGLELYLFLEGNVTFYTEKTGFSLQPGYLVPIKPGLWHRAKTMDETLYDRIYINVSQEYVNELSTPATDLLKIFKTSSKDSLPVRKLNHMQIKEFSQLSNELMRTIAEKRFGYDVMAKAYITQLFMFLYLPVEEAVYKDVATLPELLTNIMTFIDNHLNEDLSIQRFSDTFFMSGAYLSRYFKKFMGINMQDYIIDKRIELAKDYLHQGCTVDEACEYSGFGNYYHFIRCFKNRTGTTPGRYKKHSSTEIRFLL